MMDTALLNDLRSLAIGILGGVITFYLIKAIERYASRRIVRSRKRQLEQVQVELKLLEKLGSTDRAVLVFGFQLLFPLLAIISLSIAVSSFLALVHGSADAKTVIDIMVWSCVGIVSWWASTVFKKLEDPQPTLDGLRQRIRELQDEREGPL